MSEIAAIKARWTDDRPFGQQVREARLAAGLTLQDVAGRVGITVPYLSDIEREARLAWGYRERIADALGFRYVDPSAHARADVDTLLAALEAAGAERERLGRALLRITANYLAVSAEMADHRPQIVLTREERAIWEHEARAYLDAWHGIALAGGAGGGGEGRSWRSSHRSSN